MFRANKSVWILTIGLVIWFSTAQLSQAGRRNYARGWWARSLPALDRSDYTRQFVQQIHQPISR